LLLILNLPMPKQIKATKTQKQQKAPAKKAIKKQASS
jgi:hypothetical protein